MENHDTQKKVYVVTEVTDTNPYASASQLSGVKRFTRLPNPGIPVYEYNLASAFCTNFDNMTRQDWMELAIVEKLYHDKQIPEEYFNNRVSEIRNRPPRGQRKGTKKK